MQRSTGCGEPTLNRYIYIIAPAASTQGTLRKRVQKASNKIPGSLGTFEVERIYLFVHNKGIDLSVYLQFYMLNMYPLIKYHLQIRVLGASWG